MSYQNIKIVFTLLFGMSLGAGVAFIYVLLTIPIVDLPEEHKLITKKDNLIGFYDNSGTLHIEFSSNPQFIWNDDEESIPTDNSLITLEFMKDNKVYIGPYSTKAKVDWP